jgi:hypothetical protein
MIRGIQQIEYIRAFDLSHAIGTDKLKTSRVHINQPTVTIHAFDAFGNRAYDRFKASLSF